MFTGKSKSNLKKIINRKEIAEQAAEIAEQAAIALYAHKAVQK